ncbi:MAG: hypothetical protein HRF50_07145 [Phycisphaerae bacterium]|jgi:hypothetical protein
MAVRPLLNQLDRPAATALVAAMAYGLFLWAQLDNRGYDLSRYVGAGDRFCDPTATPPGLRVVQNSDGYDGQFFYRLALAPFTSRATGHGITLDSPAYRQQRIVYPILAWTLSLGRTDGLPFVLLAINAVGLVAIGGLGGAIACAFGRHALWGLLLAGYPGFFATLASDTSEIVAAGLLLAGLLALQREHAATAAVLLALAVLTRETAATVAVAAGLKACWDAFRRRRPGPRAWLPAVVPIAALLAWQAYLALRWGALPLRAGVGNIGPPLAGLWQLLTDGLSNPGPRYMLWRAQLLMFALVGALAMVTLGYTRAAPVARIAWLLELALASSLTYLVWCEDSAYLRALGPYFLLAAMILLGGPRWARFVAGAAVAIIWYPTLQSWLI